MRWIVGKDGGNDAVGRICGRASHRRRAVGGRADVGRAGVEALELAVEMGVAEAHHRVEKGSLKGS